ncbi:hypothetical protein P3L10_025978 [Capsicum annuum]
MYQGTGHSLIMFGFVLQGVCHVCRCFGPFLGFQQGSEQFFGTDFSSSVNLTTFYRYFYLLFSPLVFQFWCSLSCYGCVDVDLLNSTCERTRNPTFLDCCYSQV